jgi:voltage-gated potassium channel Kch
VLRRAGVTVFQGDARRVATLERLHSDRAVALVVAVGNPRVARLIAETASCRWPHLPVIIRARDSGRVQGQSRKVLAIPEPEAAAIALTAAVLDTLREDRCGSTEISPETSDRVA